MKITQLLAIAGCGGMLFGTCPAKAQETIMVEETVVETIQPMECKDHYSSSWRDNWFIQAGAGVQTPFVENYLENGDASHHITAVYNLGFGHWFSPYLGFRFSGYYGKLHYDYKVMNSAQMGNLNFDLMWDMTSSCCGVNPNRVFSFIPFIGVGGTYTWDFKGVEPSIRAHDQRYYKRHEWTLPVSVGFQIRLRLCKYVDFFAEARAQFLGDNFNNIVNGAPIESNIMATGGLSFNIGERKFTKYNPCDYLGYVNNLNNQVNDLRGQLASTAVALAAAEAQLPCPEIVQQEVIVEQSPMLSTVRFKINSATISEEEMVNVYNVAQYLKANPDVKVLVDGYADKDTGSSEYNMALSQRRANAVVDLLTNTYGINPDRVKATASGSDKQPYETNNWNRIVIFSQQ